MPEKKGFTNEEEPEQGTFEGDVYTEEGREELLEDDEISNTEEGMAEGFEHGDVKVTCNACGAVLAEDNTFEREINGEFYQFCSIRCAEKYTKEHTVG